MRKFFRSLTCFLSAASILTLSICTAAAYNTPDNIMLSTKNGSESISGCNLVIGDIKTSENGSDQLTAAGSLRLFGIFPVKDVNVHYTERPVVTPGGQPFGIRLYTGGLIVSRISGVPCENGSKNPAEAAGIKCGDIITHAKNQELKTNEQLMNICEKSEGEPIFLRCIRDGKYFTASVTPVLDKDLHVYRLGMWVKDSCAGIGTITFTDDKTKSFAGLGHGLYDGESGSLMPLYKGDIVPANIVSTDRGAGGSPGSLCGVFTSGEPIGTISSNSDCGIYGLCSDYFSGEKIEIAFRHEVKRGKAQILSTTEGSAPEYYNIEIEDITYNSSDPTKSIVIKITDPKLLKKTGGIVRGMSGSPIIQNGRLAGAVTHVFVNDPSRGYAVFAETMSEQNKEILMKQ